jgi:hypothetical protein
MKPKPKGGSIRDLLYRAKPGEKLQKGFAGRSLNKEQMRKDTSPRKLPTPIKIDKVKMAEESYKNYLKQRNEKIRTAPSQAKPNKDRLQSMFEGTPRKRDNSAVTYSTRVKPKFPSMMEGPYRIKKATVKTSRGR